MHKIVIKDCGPFGKEKSIDMGIGDFLGEFNSKDINSLSNNSQLLLFSWLPNIIEIKVFYYEDIKSRRLELFFDEERSIRNRIILQETELEYKIHQFLKQIYE